MNKTQGPKFHIRVVVDGLYTALYKQVTSEIRGISSRVSPNVLDVGLPMWQAEQTIFFMQMQHKYQYYN